MGILWLILKIILILILSLLGIVVLVLLLLLLWPIRYEAYLEKYEHLRYDFKVKYLIGLHAKFYRDEKEELHQIKAFGKVLYEGKEVFEEEIKGQEIKDKKHEPLKKKLAKKEAGEPKKTIASEVKKQEVVAKEVKKQEVAAKEVEKPVVHEMTEAVDEGVEEVKAETKGTIRRLNFEQVKRLFLSHEFYEMICDILKSMKRLIKYLLPYDWSFEVILGRDDPAETGELLAKLCVLYPLYAGHGYIKGDFEKSRLEGGFLAEGQFNIAGLLKIIVSLLLHKSVRIYIRLIRKIRKEERNGK